MSRIIILVCLVLAVQGFDLNCDHSHTRFRRSRNYYGPSQKFYKPPPNLYPIRGLFSYTPPPGYGHTPLSGYGADSGLPSYRPKVSKRHNSGLGEYDLHNIVKYLSKQDLDKIFELAKKRGKYTDDSDEQTFGSIPNDSPANYKDNRPVYPDDDDFQNGKMYGPHDSFRAKPKGFEHDPMPNIYNKEYLDEPPRGEKYYSQPPLDIEARSKTRGFEDDSNPNIYDNEYSDQKPPKNDIFYSRAPLDGNESNLHNNISPLDQYIDKVVADDLSAKDVFDIKFGEWTSEPMKDFDIAFTNKSPKIVKSESTSYKLENFADLPLMNYDSKLDTVNSYSVPHYTVTSHNHNQPPATKSASSVRPDQSDAHLKAVRIWTHKSQGAAYTLHDDGTLSPERPNRPKF